MKVIVRDYKDAILILVCASNVDAAAERQHILSASWTFNPAAEYLYGVGSQDQCH